METIQVLEMEKIMFMPEGSDKPASFYVLEQTKIRGFSYILVTDREEGDAECLILKEKSKYERFSSFGRK